MLVTEIAGGFLPCDVEVMKLLEEAKEWEKLEVWIVTMWWPPYNWFDEEMEDIAQATLNLLSQRPSVLPRFEDRVSGKLVKAHKIKLREICDKARADPQLSLSSEPSPP
jgi:pyruvate-formate lyase-activating enzyme